MTTTQPRHLRSFKSIRLSWWLYTAFVLSAVSATAEPQADAQPPVQQTASADFTAPDWDVSQASSSQLAAIEHILQLNQDELTALRQTLDRIASLTPEQHAALLQRVHEFRKMSERERRRIIAEYRELPQEERRLLRAYWHNLSPEKAQQTRDQLRRMSQQQRLELRDHMIEKARSQGLQEKSPSQRRSMPRKDATTEVNDQAE